MKFNGIETCTSVFHFCLTHTCTNTLLTYTLIISHLLLQFCTEIKQISTGVHFFSLMVLMIFFFIGHEKTFQSFIVAAVSFTLAFFIPPTGIINPDDAMGDEYAKKAMGWSPYAQIEAEAAARKAKEEAAAAEKVKGKKKKGGKKNK